jgi:DNA sulfur modification protein DndD
MIKSLQFSNFGCFKNTHSPINFSTDTNKNVTVILGDNKSGKTTLVQAFLWCLYGEISPKNGVINSEAKNEMASSSTCEVFVEIVLIHAYKEFTIRRTQQFTKNNGRVKNDDSILKIQYKEANGEQQSIPSRDCADTINNILPKGLSDYFFYEGERFDDISKKDVATAVRGLMGLDTISSARDRFDPNRAGSVTSKISKGRVLVNPQENDHLKQSLSNSQDEHETIIKRIENVKSEHEYYIRRKEELEEKLSQNSIVKSLQAKRKSLENDVKIGQSNIEEASNRILSDFQQKALAFFALPLINRALSVIEDSKQSGEGIPEMRQAAIDHILKRKRCICGCDLEENEGAQKRILAERDLLPPEHLGTILYNHKQTLLEYQGSSVGFVEEVNKNYANWRKNIRFLDEKNDDLSKVSEEIIAAGSVDVEGIEKEYQENEEKLCKLIQLREELLVKKGIVEGNIANFEKMIASYVEKTDSNNKLQCYIAYAEALFKLFDTSYSKREQEVKANLNESVNRIFSEMYHGHRMVLIDNNYQIKLLTTVGSSQEEIADTGGLRAVKNFAYITGLVDIARKRVTQENKTNENDEDPLNETEPYPLVMDAPFSATDEKHINNISRIVPGIAEQVVIIIMQKDWVYAKPAIETRIGKRYVIENIDNSEICSRIREGE